MFKLYCRIFQFIMKLAANFLPWRKPALLEGENSVVKLPERISAKGIDSVLLVTDAGIMSLGLCDALLEALRAAGVSAVVYDKTVPNPTIDNIEEALMMYKENGCGGIIAVGGGSSMDCAKGVGARVARPRKSITRMKGLLKIMHRLPPLFAVPTTAGTGSEATVAAVVVDAVTHEKYALMDPALIPHEAVLDPLLTVGLPKMITATTGMDALTHAVEAYIGRSNTQETRDMARRTVTLVFENLYTAFIDGKNIAARENMQRAAFYGGVAFTRAYVGNVHAVAHTLGGMYSVPHGLANAVILPYILDDFGESVYRRLAELAELVSLPGNTDEQKAKAFIQAIRDMNTSMGIPTTIDGIKEEDVPLMAERAFHEANPTYPVPRIFTREDFVSVYHRLMGKPGSHGYAGKMAEIDLTTGEIKHFMPQKDDLAKYLGGKGLAAKIIYDRLFGNTDVRAGQASHPNRSPAPHDGKAESSAALSSAPHDKADSSAEQSPAQYKVRANGSPEMVEAFSDENLIVITTAPLNGSAAPSSSRFNISTISPLTGLLVSSNCGGDFGLKLKRAGYDALVISGKSPGKVYIRVSASGIELCDAADIWGASTSEAQAAMGERVSAAQGAAAQSVPSSGAAAPGMLAIGIAGENLVRYAGVASQERMAGRGGVGAVFGYKGLKGIVAEGSAQITMPDRDAFKSFNKKWIGKLRKHVLTGKQLPELGTGALLRMMQDRGILATANYSAGRFDKYDSISGETLREKHLVKNQGCVTCPIQCGRVVMHEGRRIKGPELETLGLLGANIMNGDLDLIIRLNYLCDEYGLDTMSFGGSVAFAMELNEKGMWDNGLRFGECETLEQLVGAVARREGIGDDIAEGVLRLSEKYGGKEFAVHAKGLELAAYEPRTAQGMGLGYATANRGGCHLNGGYMVVLEGLGMRVNGRTTRGKAQLTVFFQDLMEAASAAGNCLFTTYAVFPSAIVRNPGSLFSRFVYSLMPLLGGPAAFIHNHPGLLGVNARGMVPYPYAYKLVTGSDMNIGRFVKAGERIYNLERLINTIQGLSSGDTLPDRLTRELKDGNDSKSRVRLDVMLKKYYRIRGWDGTGTPDRKRLARLGL